MVTSRRRALDAALVLDYLITHDAHFLCDRDTTPACAHVVQSVCSQVQCGVHTSTATFMFGLAQLSTKEDKKQFSNAGDIVSASSMQRTTYVHISHNREHGCGRAAHQTSSIVASMLPLPCHACHSSPHLVLRPAVPHCMRSVHVASQSQ